MYQFRVEAGKAEAFEAAWAAMTHAIRDSQDGARGSQLMRDPEDPTRYVALATWESVAHWQNARSQPSANPEAGQQMRAVCKALSTDVFQLVTDLTVH